MSKLILSVMVSADGYMEGPNRDLNWHVWDDEMSDYMLGVFDEVDALIYGRSAYELMIQYWPAAAADPQARPRDLEFARRMNDFRKYVLTGRQSGLEWNSVPLGADYPEQIRRLKASSEKDLICFGGAKTASALADQGLIDEFRFLVNPRVLGAGQSVLPTTHSVPLNLLEARKFGCGNVLLRYAAGE